MSRHEVAKATDARIPLPPNPEGWYCVGFRWELRRPVEGVWCGRRLRLSWPRRSQPKATALDGGPTPEVVAQQDALFFWHGPEGGPARFRIPPVRPEGWTPYVGHTWHNLATHPQETSENSVDIAHFRVVHQYEDVQELRPAETDGPFLTARYGFRRGVEIAGRPLFYAQVEFDVIVAGLGYSRVDADVINLGLRTRQMVYATPRERGRCDLRIALSAPLGSSPLSRLKARIVRDVVLPGYIHDVGQDLTIWQTKRHLQRPRIVAGDGPIGRYRAWCRQFYPEAA